MPQWNSDAAQSYIATNRALNMKPGQVQPVISARKEVNRILACDNSPMWNKTMASRMVNKQADFIVRTLSRRGWFDHTEIEEMYAALSVLEMFDTWINSFDSQSGAYIVEEEETGEEDVEYAEETVTEEYS